MAIRLEICCLRRMVFAWTMSASTFGFAAAPTSSPASLCAKWAGAVEVGQLNTKLIDESSGLAVSRSHGVLYHINDSGSGPVFFVSDRKGQSTVQVTIDKFKPIDTEEIALGPCPNVASSCLVVADIGDNMKRRKDIELLFIEEKASYASPVRPTFRLKLKYPDGAHNAEAMAVLPNGDIVIVTKEQTLTGEATPAQVFRIAKNAYLKPSNKALVLDRIGEIDVPALVSSKGFGGRVTAMSVSSDGKRFLLLTYNFAIEFNLDLSLGSLPKLDSLKAGRDYRVISIPALMQQESISYDVNDRDFFYTTELIKSFFGKDAPAPLQHVSCIE